MEQEDLAIGERIPEEYMSSLEGERVIRERSRYYRFTGDHGQCKLTGQICDNAPTDHDCRSCLVPIYMWMLENGVRE